MKIAFIAMSGVRAHNEELTQIGLSLPAFAERSQVIASLPSLSLLTLAGMTPERFDVSYHEIDDIRQLDALPSCDLAAISTFTAQAKDAYELAHQYRQAGVKTVMGGLHATALPQEALSHFDAVVVGEGELSWPTLLTDLQWGRMRQFYGPEGREFDLAQAPMPRFDLLEVEKYNRLSVQTQRGCPWRCEFCASSITLTPRYKLKPVPKVIEEIGAIKAMWPRPFIEFADDNTFVNKRHSKELMRALAGEGVRWFTETDVSVADDPELLALMREAGCVQVLIGLESPTSVGLEGVELRQDWKRRQIHRYQAAVECIQSHGITVNGCFVLGLDGHTTEVFDQVQEFVQKSGLCEVQITVMTAFPGTPLYSRLKSEGRLIDEVGWEKCTLFDVNVRPDRMSIEELERGLIELGRLLYSAEAKQARLKAFKQQIRYGGRQRRRSEVWRSEQQARDQQH
jgi:radical SAM superfamily enzyme YgiQ (UPF0313 family)